MIGRRVEEKHREKIKAISKQDASFAIELQKPEAMVEKNLRVSLFLCGLYFVKSLPWRFLSSRLHQKLRA